MSAIDPIMTGMISNREVDVVIINIGHLVAQAAYVEDHGTRTNETILDHERRQEEVAEVICRELTLDTVLRDDIPSRCHHTRIVDEEVNSRSDLFNAFHRSAHGFVRQQVQRHDLDFDFGIGFLDGVDDGRDLGLIAPCQNEQFWTGTG
jgi:hypothetical protein